MKKGLLIAGFIVAVIVLGDILLIITGNKLVANWGSIIIPSFFLGMVAKRMLNPEEIKKFSKIAAASMVAAELILMFIRVKNPTILALILIGVIYYFVSELLITIGEGTTKSDK